MASLLENRDIFNAVVSEWLDLKDLVNLDTAMCSIELRDLFLSLLHAVPFPIPFANRIHDWWKNHQHCLKWFANRRMCESRGQLNVHQKLWENLLLNQDVDYLPFLQGIRDLRFLGFSGSFDFTGLEECSRLTQLHFCNLSSTQTPPRPLKSSSLELLSLQNSLFDNAVIQEFLECENLKTLDLIHAKYPFSLSIDHSKIFLGRIENVRVLGDVNAFLSLLNNITTGFTSVYFDKAHKSEAEPFNPQQLLQLSPNIRELTIARMRIEPVSFLNYLHRFGHFLDYIHLNHCKLVDDVAWTHDEDENGATLNCGKLKLSSLLFLTNNSLSLILRAFKDKLRHLSLSYCSRISDEGFLIIPKLCPNLVYLEIADKQVCWDESRIFRISEIFAGIPNFRIVLWQDWLTEDQKASPTHLQEREVKFERWSEYQS